MKFLPERRTLIALRGLTIASFKMYVRNRRALFFSLFFPVVFIVLFGTIFKTSTTSFNVRLVKESHTEIAEVFASSVWTARSFKVQEVSAAAASAALDKGDADLVVTIPKTFGQLDEAGLPQEGYVKVYFNAARPGNGQAAAQIVSQLAHKLNDDLIQAPQLVQIWPIGVHTKNLGYIDFLLPGMVALSIMQLGIFSVAFSLITYKTTGILRRLQATPVHPGSFLVAQSFTRLMIAVVQTLLLAGIGLAFFEFHLSASSYPAFMIVSLLGSAVFMAMGFAVASWAKNEDQVQPVVQLIQFPMMFLSGTFFPRGGFPEWLQHVTQFLPLTYLADALRHIANDGASLWAVRGDVLGLTVWGIVAAIVAVRLFRWE